MIISTVIGDPHSRETLVKGPKQDKHIIHIPINISLTSMFSWCFFYRKSWRRISSILKILFCFFEITPKKNETILINKFINYNVDKATSLATQSLSSMQWLRSKVIPIISHYLARVWNPSGTLRRLCQCLTPFTAEWDLIPLDPAIPIVDIKLKGYLKVSFGFKLD